MSPKIRESVKQEALAFAHEQFPEARDIRPALMGDEMLVEVWMPNDPACRRFVYSGWEAR